MAGHASSGDIELDWLRLASDRNVSHDVARAMWEEARAASPDDPLQAEQAFHLMLDDAEAANITHEPGRETLAGRGSKPRDTASLGPGKWTRVLLEQAPAPAQPVVRKPTAESIRSELASAGQAGKQVAEMLAASDPATIVEALRGLSQSQTGIVGKLLSMATGAVERALERSANWDIKVTPAAAKPTTPPIDPETGEPLESAGPVAEDEHLAPAAPPPPPDDKPEDTDPADKPESH